MRVRESEICKVRMRESDLVHGLDSARRARLLSEGYKAKSPAAASLAIIHHVGLSDRAELSKNLQGFIVTGCMLRKSTQENIRTVCFVVSRIRSGVWLPNQKDNASPENFRMISHHATR